MVKVYGPMMSLDASGTLANAITFAKWKGRNYVRERIIPSNPKSGAQTGRRAMFSFLAKGWQALATADQASWDTLGDDLIASPFNGFVSSNMKGWHNFLPPTQNSARTASGTPSDNDLSAAAWEENRIKISYSGAALGDAWGFLIFASKTGVFATSVGNAILALPDFTIAATDIFWTPPEVTTWYLNIRTFADDGVLSAEGTEQTAAPP